jgi:hypothetical protein
VTGAAGASTGAATGAGIESIANPCERISASRSGGALRTATGFKPCDLNKVMRAVPITAWAWDTKQKLENSQFFDESKGTSED